jgi:hypothetical protein
MTGPGSKPAPKASESGWIVKLTLFSFTPLDYGTGTERNRKPFF